MTLTAEENEKLTRVGPGTPMGELMRRYWRPIAASAELIDRPTKAVDIQTSRSKSGAIVVLERSEGGTLWRHS